MWGPRSAKLPSKMQAPHMPVSEMGGQVSRGSLPQAVLTKKTISDEPRYVDDPGLPGEADGSSPLSPNTRCTGRCWGLDRMKTQSYINQVLLDKTTMVIMITINIEIARPTAVPARFCRWVTECGRFQPIVNSLFDKRSPSPHEPHISLHTVTM